jgi:nitrile hydratase subunit beta
MNSVHDMGGMHGMGPIVYEAKEPVFHVAWEGRVYALMSATGRWGRGRWRGFRYELERIPAAEYLRMSYYERWFYVLVDRLVRTGLVSREELESGKADPSAPAPRILEQPGGAQRSAARQNVRIPARYKAGQRVRVRNMHPVGHTRLPRYARGKRGTILRDHGVWNLQDTDTESVPIGGPQHVYTVRFPARELWGDQASPRDNVYVDMWEHYLERD